MGNCIYNSWEGVCTFYDEELGNIKNVDETDYGFIGEGICVVEDDEDPTYTCSAYESHDKDDEDHEDTGDYTIEEMVGSLESLDLELD